MTASIDWTEDAIVRLRSLWDEGHSTSEIGRRMHITKNAIIGKVHRLALPPRPSPIRGSSDSTPRAVRPPRTRGPTLPPLGAAAAGAPAAATPRPAPAVAARPPERHYAGPSGKPCCWSIGDPGEPGFRFCGEGTPPGKPYCPEHAEAAYVRPTTARDRPDGRSLDRYLRQLIRTPAD